MRQTRGIAAYGRCWDDSGRVLLTRIPGPPGAPDVWSLPGGGIVHGEHPADAVVRQFAAMADLEIDVTGAHDVVSDVRLPAGRDEARHTDRVIYDVAVRGPASRSAPDGSAWLTGDEVAGLSLTPFTSMALGLSTEPSVSPPVEPTTEPEPEPEVRLAVDPAVLGVANESGRAATGPGKKRHRTGQRFAAYGLVTDPANRVLLTLIAEGFPGSGHWHLPGGGTDHGEQPAEGFLRELFEEAGQTGRLVGLLGVSHRRAVATGPEGYPLDWHAVRVVYRAVVDEPTPPRVTEGVGGSTAKAAWFTRERAEALRLTEIAELALSGFDARGRAAGARSPVTP